MLKLIIQLIFTLIFVGLAVYNFMNGAQIEGVLWLILCELWQFRVQSKEQNDDR